jgi:transcriptional regulator with XRE-family HTH domain
MVQRYMGERVKARREEMGLSQDELARAIGVSTERLKLWETGLDRIPPSEVVRVATALEVTIGYLFPKDPEATQ